MNITNYNIKTNKLQYQIFFKINIFKKRNEKKRNY